MTLISKSKPASQFTPTAVQFGIGLLGKHLVFDCQDHSELRGGIGMEGRDVDDVVESAAGSIQDRSQIVESKLDLPFKAGLGGAVLATADLSGVEEQVARTGGGRIAVGLIKNLPASRENRLAPSHKSASSSGEFAGREMRPARRLFKASGGCSRGRSGRWRSRHAGESRYVSRACLAATRWPALASSTRCLPIAPQSLICAR